MALHRVLPITDRRDDTARHIPIRCFPHHLDNDNEVRTDRDGDPIYERLPLQRPFDDFFGSGTLKNFDMIFCHGKSEMTRSEEHLFRLLANSCSYCDLPLLFDHNKRLLRVGTNGESIVKAFLVKAGNVSKHFFLDEIAKQLRYDDKTIRSDINGLRSKGLIQDEELDPSAVTNMKRSRINSKGGRPPKIVRFRLHPYFAWCGHPGDWDAFVQSDAYKLHNWTTMIGT